MSLFLEYIYSYRLGQSISYIELEFCGQTCFGSWETLGVSTAGLLRAFMRYCAL